MTDPIPVLSLWQPWASLVALGVKTIEARSQATNHRGPLAIHAAGWMPEWGEIGDYYVEPWFDAVRHVEDCCCEEGGVAPECARRSKRRPVLTRYSVVAAALPLGAIVATCTLVDVVPIMANGVDRLRSHIDLGDGRLWTCSDGALWDHPADIEDQRPYGDFTAGRYAWLLGDIVLVDPPVPFKGRPGLTGRYA